MGETFVPQATTLQSSAVRMDWLVFLIAGAIVALAVYALILYPVIRYARAGAGGALPPQFRRNNRMAVLYVTTPIVIVIGLFVLTYRVESTTDETTAQPAVRVGVLAYRWGWRFTYPSAGGFVIDGSADTGPELVIPTGERVRFDITSDDVNHAFWVPAFGLKRDAIPGTVNHIEITPEREGVYRGECAEFCGLRHALMAFSVRVVSPKAYERWARDRRAHVHA